MTTARELSLELALETERLAANMYARQVAHWIHKYDELLAEQLDVPATEWISANERKPLESDGTVAVLMDDGSVLTAWATYWHGASTGFAEWTHPYDVDDSIVTHWCHLPKPPTLTKGG
jgi:hypothetical protein